MKNYEKILRSLCERPPFVFRAHWDHEPRISETASPRCCRHLYLFTALPTLVAQTCSLLYRRFVTCGSPAKSRALGVTDAWPITNRRYGRLKICATVNRYGRQHPGLNTYADRCCRGFGEESASYKLVFDRADRISMLVLSRTQSKSACSPGSMAKGRPAASGRAGRLVALLTQR